MENKNDLELASSNSKIRPIKDIQVEPNEEEEEYLQFQNYLSLKICYLIYIFICALV